MSKIKELHISRFKNDEDLHCVILQAIRSIGVEHTYKKCPFCRRSHVSRRVSSATSVFRKPLDQLNAVQVTLGCGMEVEIPAFLIEACQHIEENCDEEGLFRKAGSSARQKEIRVYIEAGKKLGPQHHVIDVANILKLFLRELPDPLLPYNYHDLFLRCLVLEDRQVEAIMLTCFLLPICHLNTLAFLMKFLQKVASRAGVNKMTKSNLALVITPTVMPVEFAFNASRITHHIRVIENLLNNADRIGIIPELIIDKALNSGLLSTPSTPSSKSASSEDIPKSKKKRRSGSLTSMINSIKKMGKVLPDVEENNLLPSTPDCSTPCRKFAKKRKTLEPLDAFSSKKNKAAGDCRLKKARLSLGSKTSCKKQNHGDDLMLANHDASDTGGHSDSAGLSSVKWRRSFRSLQRRITMDFPFISDADTSNGSYRPFLMEAEVDLSDNCVILDSIDSDSDMATGAFNLDPSVLFLYPEPLDSQIAGDALL